MRTITFKEFLTDYREYFHITEKRVIIENRDLDNIMDILYDVENYEFNYDNNTIEIY